jgi:transposase-like protein
MRYTKELRQKVLSMKAKNGWTFQKTAEHFEICIRTLFRWSKCIEIKKRKEYKTKINIELLKKDVELYPDAYQYERAKRLGVSDVCVLKNLRKLKISYKKKLNPPES